MTICATAVRAVALAMLSVPVPALAQAAPRDARSPSPPPLHELRPITDGVNPEDARWTSGFGLEGPGGGPVYALATLGCDIYVAGQFSIATVDGATRNIARWDGYNWHALGEGVDNIVDCMAVFDDDAEGPNPPALFVGGYFTNAGGQQALRVAKWNGAAWSTLGAGLGGVSVNQIAAFDMLVHDDGAGPALYVAGRFQTAGAGAALNLARWDGVQWSPVGPGFTGTCQPVPSPPTTTETFVAALASFDDTPGVPGPSALYAGGCFNDVGGLFAKNIARWDGASWTSLGAGGFNGVDGAVETMLVHDDGSGPGLYVGGRFLQAGINPYRHLARWNADRSWSPLGTPLSNSTNNWVYCLATYQDSPSGPASLYVGGLFNRAFAGGVTTIAPGAARWRQGAWQPLDTGVNFGVTAFAVYDDPREMAPRLYVGGTFTTAGSLDVNSIARWNGSQWSALVTQTGDGMNDEVYSLAEFDPPGPTPPSLYAGGKFTAASGAGALGLARWNGVNWATVGAGLTGGAPSIAHALAVWDDDGAGPRPPALYCAGRFVNAGALQVRGVARWDGAAWEALGSPPNVGVGGVIPFAAHALCVWNDGSGEALYVGGDFTSAGGVAAQGIARWNGAAWNSLGSGVAGGNPSFKPDVRALAVFNDGSGEALYAAGNFTSVDGVAANFVARWDGAAWTPVGAPGHPDGVDGRVEALHVFAGRLVAGGRFFTAGGAQSPFIGAWDGAAWATLDQGLNNFVFSLTTHDDGSGPALYAGGFFTGTWNSLARRYIARWNGASWSALGSGMDLSVLALRSFDDGAGLALWAGGGFSTAGEKPSAFVARWGEAPFQNAVPVPAGDAPSGVAVADFDDDPAHLPDLAVVNADSGDVTVLFNTGAPGGTPSFTPPLPANTYAVGAMPLSIASADFNEDGRPDLAVANAASNSISVLLNNGAGSFTPGPTLAGGAQPVHVSAADLNGDDHPDLLVANRLGDAVGIHPGMGGGAFGPDQPQMVPPGGRPNSTGSGDLDNDKDVDVVVSLEAAGAVAVFPNQGNTDGAPMFGAPLIFSVATCGDPAPRSVVVADFNNDGLLDVAVANTATNSVVVLLNLGGVADGWLGLRPPTPLSVGDSPVSIAAGDFFGTGRQDLVSANAFSNPDGSISALRNITPPGSFSAVYFEPAVSLATPPDPAFVTGADLNADASLDVTLANGFLIGADGARAAFAGRSGPGVTGAAAFMLNQSSAPLVAPCPGDANGDRVVDFLDLNLVLSFYGAAGIPGVQPGDLDADGDVDFVDLNLALSFYGVAC